MAETTQTDYLDPATLDKIKRLDVKARLVVEGFVTVSYTHLTLPTTPYV